jgi:hypothetical protein
MHVRVWRALCAMARLVVGEATRAFLDWAWRKRPRQRRPWQQRRESEDSWT